MLLLPQNPPGYDRPRRATKNHSAANERNIKHPQSDTDCGSQRWESLTSQSSLQLKRKLPPVTKKNPHPARSVGDVRGITCDGCWREAQRYLKVVLLNKQTRRCEVDVEVVFFLVMASSPESQWCQVRAQHISAPFKTLPGRVNSCRLELEINYSASTSSLSLWMGFSVLSLPAHFSLLAVSN